MASQIPDEHIRDVAAETKFTTNELEKGIETLNEALQSVLVDIYKDSKLSGLPDRVLFEENDEVWVAFSHLELRHKFRSEDLEIDDDLLLAVAHVHRNFFHGIGLTVSFSRQYFETFEDTNFFPLLVVKPEAWLDGEYRVEQQFHELTLYYEMSPAEALDYWGIVERNVDTTEWARRRGVGAEAVRKNVRAAKKKLENEDMGRTPPEENISAVSVDDVPPEFHDTERVFMPTDEQLDAYEASLDE